MYAGRPNDSSIRVATGLVFVRFPGSASYWKVTGHPEPVPLQFAVPTGWLVGGVVENNPLCSKKLGENEIKERRVSFFFLRVETIPFSIDLEGVRESARY